MCVVIFSVFFPLNATDKKQTAAWLAGKEKGQVMTYWPAAEASDDTGWLSAHDNKGKKTDDGFNKGIVKSLHKISLT